jgi:hypothetical protein
MFQKILKHASGAETMAQKRIRRTVKTEDISCSGPIRHEQLTPEQEARARDTFKRFARFLPDFPFERYEHSFRRDMYPDRELSVWEACAETFEQYVRPEGLSDEKLAATILQLSLGHTDGQDNKLVRLFKKRLQHHLPGDSGSILAMQL